LNLEDKKININVAYKSKVTIRPRGGYKEATFEL
jgi:hypothetical protein